MSVESVVVAFKYSAKESITSTLCVWKIKIMIDKDYVQQNVICFN